jgi:hypothetical protein
MFIAFLTLLSALSISGVAIFYSVIGLATIFPGAFWPVVIMGSVLEVGKLVTASWLYRNWKHTRFLLKTYLTIAVVVLSLITSMGIFGFLSKAHLEQNLAEDTVTQRIDIINNKIESEKTYIKRQNAVIERAEKNLNRSTTSNTDAINIEKESLKDAEDKFKTLLTVETNTIENLNNRLKQLDKDVSDVLTSNKSFFNEEKAAADLKASQKEERASIDKGINEAQSRIDILKSDYAKDTAVIQARIDKLREGTSDSKVGVEAQIETAENNILKAQNNIDDLIIEREPLESKMIKLEAEVGPVKYIASLVVDWGVTTEVDTSEAVRWVILIIIFVFDPLAVLLLVAANQSLIRRFPVDPPPPPDEIIDLEKPELDEIIAKPNNDTEDEWNSLIEKATIEAQKEQLNKKVKEWNEKLEKFNTVVDEPETKPVEFIQEEQKKTEEKEIAVDKEKQLEEFKQREQEELKALEEYARKAREEVDNTKDGFDPAEVEGYEEFNKKYDMDPVVNPEWEETLPKKEVEPIPETVSAILPEHKEPKVIDAFKPKERIKPDLTEVIEPQVKNAKPNVLRTLKETAPAPEEEQKKMETKPLSPEESEEMLKQFHAKNGNFKDISDSELKAERDASNKAQFLEDVGITEQDAKNHPAITKSRLEFFKDHVDDVLRGNTTAENLPPDVAKTVAILLSDYDNPPIKEPEITAVEQTGLSTMTSEELAERFGVEPETEDRDMSEEELDNLLEGFNEDDNGPDTKYEIKIQNGRKVRVPIKEEGYEQNAEQSDTTLWNKTKELDLPEPEKNEIILPDLPQTEEVEIADKVEETEDALEEIQPEHTISPSKIANYKKRVIEDVEYQKKIEARIDGLISKLENKEITMDDLTEQDRKVIIDIMNQNNG